MNKRFYPLRRPVQPNNVAPQHLHGPPWWGLAFAVALTDQGTKYAVQSGLTLDAVVPVTGFFNLVHRWNTGAAFSFLADADGWQRYFLSALALIVAAALTWMLSRPRPRSEALAYALILGGALGNAADRIVRGYVVDFLDFHWHGWSWPAFNLADAGICVGAALLIAASFRRDQPAR
ncbi:MAG: signal peptidase II [Burkholderiaceae bacterium]|nr:signal peptidase II [Burkholderiaceae bacterium]